ncbi:TetR/AcrR family transcriptional regulator [Nocardia sp. NPDC050713]|uniref:TetR/AcrR family transcriptional regulator n=1 Tax=Nocardia sp. NPDC050713 TaxID=3154511 RepID=UPI0033C10671
MTPRERRIYGGETAEQRAGRRREGFIEAAISVVASRGWRQLSVERIAERAGIGKRYFYECFTDLDTLAAAVIDKLSTEVLLLSVAEDNTAPLEQMIRAMAGNLTNYALAQPDRVRVLFSEMAATEAAAKRRTEAVHRIVEVLAAEVRAIHNEDNWLIDITATVLVNGSIQAIIDWLDGTLALTQQQFIDHMTTLWLLNSEGVRTAHSPLR